jgi:hypothetical protein
MNTLNSLSKKSGAKHPELKAIIHNFHVIAMPRPPHETDSPLVVYPYRVLFCPVASQGLQLVSGRRRQDAQFSIFA